MKTDSPRGMFHFFQVMMTALNRIRVETYFTARCNTLVRAGVLGRIAYAITFRKNNV